MADPSDFDLRQSDTGLTDQVPGADELSASSWETVEAELRTFLGAVATKRALVLEGKLTEPAFRAWAQEQGYRMQRVLYGQEPGYKATPWNSPDHLGRFLVEQVEIGGSRDDAVFRMMGRLFKTFAEQLSRYEQDEISLAVLGANADELIHQWTTWFLGLPGDDVQDFIENVD